MYYSTLIEPSFLPHLLPFQHLLRQPSVPGASLAETSRISLQFGRILGVSCFQFARRAAILLNHRSASFHHHRCNFPHLSHRHHLRANLATLCQGAFP